MTKIAYSIKFLDYWHIGSGVGGGVLSDAIVLKDERGLPFVPGKTMKGLVRETAHKNQDIEFIRSVLGEENENDLKETFFSSAKIAQDIPQHLSDYLYDKLSFTAINPKTGVAKDSSLRDIDFVVPLELEGFVTVADEWAKKLSLYLTSVKHMGLNRNRGFGRCHVTITKEEHVE